MISTVIGSPVSLGYAGVVQKPSSMANGPAQV